MTRRMRGLVKVEVVSRMGFRSWPVGMKLYDPDNCGRGVLHIFE